MKPLTQDERLMAMLVHLCVLLPTYGFIGAIVIWVTQKEKSAYVRAHGVQAIGWQILLIAVYIGGMMLYMLSFVGFFVGIGLTGPDAKEPPVGAIAFMVLPFAMIGLVFLVMLAMVIVAIVAAVRAYGGSLCRYPLIGGLLERMAEGSPPAQPTASPDAAPPA
jgi:uncharacterized protein